MNKVIGCFFLFFLGHALAAQTYLINQNDSIITCTGSLFDSGGNGGNYGANQNFEYEICSSDPALKAQLIFTSFLLSPGDTLCFYDGSTTIPATLIGCFGGSQLAGGTITSNYNPCLTITFNSDAAGQTSGWEANINCANCQAIEPALISNPLQDPNPDSLFIEICPGNEVIFEPATIYPENNTNYAQHDTTSTFEWGVAGQQFSGDSVPVFFGYSGYFPVSLEVTDINGCVSQKELVVVRVSKKPTFIGTEILPVSGTYCIGDSLALNGAYQTEYISYSYANSGDTTFLPDGSGASYSTDLAVGGFSTGQTVTSASDILSICLNMEHSYLGDLDIELVCPNGASIFLEEYPGGAGVFLGGAIDDGTNTPGIGWDYCWENSNPNGTMDDYVSNNGLGSGDTLPATTYQAVDPFSNLIGCPLNGNWTIVVTDNLGVDNGYIFGWSVNFEPSLYPVQIGFTPHIDQAWWIDPIQDSLAGDTTFSEVILPGANLFEFHVLDDLGCYWDTSITINATPSPVGDFDFTNTCLHQQPFVFQNTSVGNNTVSSAFWNFGDGNTSNTLSPSHIYSLAGDYTVSLEVTNNNGCKDDTSILVTVFPEPIADFQNSLACLGEELFFGDLSSTIPGTNIVSWNWDFNDGSLVSTDQNPSHLFPDNQLYQVTLVVENNHGCLDTITKPIEVYEAPVANFSLDKPAGCPQLCIQFVDQSTFVLEQITSWTYAVDGSVFSNAQNPYQCFDQPGIHKITLVATNQYGCADTVGFDIEVYPFPEAQFTFQPEQPNMLNPEVHFLNSSLNTDVYEWEIGNAMFSQAVEPEYTFPDSGTYWVYLTASSNEGCIDVDSIEIKVKPYYTIYVPNTFTPNADLKNDVFEPVYINLVDAQWTIFDRWGEKVHEAQYPSLAWDGKIDGKPARTGVYTYVLDYRGILNPKQLHTKRGSVLLLR